MLMKQLEEGPNLSKATDIQRDNFDSWRIWRNLRYFSSSGLIGASYDCNQESLVELICC